MASFTDDFNRANSTSLGAGWIEVSGDWSIVSNQLSSGSAGGTIILRAAGAMASSDHYAQVTIAATTAASHGVWCRGNASGGLTSGYLWRNDGTSWDLFSVVGGSFSVIGTYVAAAAPGDVAKVQAVGSTIKGYVNGIQRVSVTNTDVPTGTSVGLRSESTNSIRFDDFAAADVGGSGATLGIASAAEAAQPFTGSKAAALGTAGAPAAAQALVGSKTAALALAAGQDGAQPLAGAKTRTLGIASGAEPAQGLAGAKAAALAPTGTVEAAQPITGAKTAPIGAANASEAGQGLTGAKAAFLGTALESSDAPALVGTKATSLPNAAESTTAMPLGVTAGRSLAGATSVEDARPLAGSKTAILAPALEVSSARPLVAAGPDVDVDVTVGVPYSPWTTGPPHGNAWSAQAPHASGWEVGAPC